MQKDYSSNASWNNAAIAGFIMALVTICLELVRTLCTKVPGFAGGFLNFTAWAVKLFICAYTFRALMKRFHQSFSGVDYFALRKYGLRLALLSAILMAAYSAINLLVINPDSMNEIINSFREGYPSMLDSNSEAALEKMLPKMPVYTSIVTAVYCFLWGWLYTSLFAKSIAPFDPFADMNDTPDNQ